MTVHSARTLAPVATPPIPHESTETAAGRNSDAIGSRKMRSAFAVLLATVAVFFASFVAPATAQASAAVDNFVNQYNGRMVDFDGAYGAQCTDLVEVYNRDVVRAPKIGGNGKDMFARASANHYHKLGAGTAPVKGDIAVWGSSVGGGYGHVAIVLADQGGSVRILSQNNHAPYAGNTPTGIISMSKNGIIGYLRPKNLTPPPPTGQTPFGHFDAVLLAEPGRIAVRGWALDRDDAGRAIDIHIYVGGDAGTPGAEGHVITANKPRADVNNAHGVPGNHGFDHFINTKKHGHHKVCAYAMGIGAGGNQFLDCKTVVIPNPNPEVNYEEASSPKPGHVKVKGWTFDRSKLEQSLEVHVYIGGGAGTAGAESRKIKADIDRPDVRRVFSIPGNHGFDSVLQTKKVGKQEVCVYAINYGVGWDNTLMGCKTVTIEAAPEPVLPPSSSIDTGSLEGLLGSS